MRIAVAYNNDQVFQHFGHTSHFKFYDIDNGKISGEQVVDTSGQGHGALAGFLKERSADTLICGGIGGGAQRAIKAAGVEIYAGISGNADEAVQALIEGSLPKNDNVTCDHHDHEGHHHDHHHEHHHKHHHEHHHAHRREHHHECGSHGCGHHEGHEGCMRHSSDRPDTGNSSGEQLNDMETVFQ